MSLLRNQKKTILILLIGMATLLLYFLQFPSQREIIRGNLDLSDWNFREQGVYYLHGEWEEYPFRFLAGDNLSHPEDPVFYRKVPGVWNSGPEERRLPAQAFATYRIMVKLDPGMHYYLHVGDMGTSYLLFVNGKEISRNGKVGVDSATQVPALRPITACFDADREWNELVIQISNFHYGKGGIWSSIVLGDFQSMNQYVRNHMLQDMLLLGFLTGTLILYLVMGWFLHYEKSFMTFALFSGLLMLRILVTNEKHIYLFFENLSFFALIRLEYLSYYLILPVFLWFLKEFLGLGIFPGFMKGFIGFYILQSLLVCFTKPIFFSSLLWISNLVTLLAGCYVIFLLLQNTGKAKGPGPEILIGFSVFFFFVVIEIISTQSNHWTVRGMQWGIIVFVLSVFTGIAKKFSMIIGEIIRKEQISAARLDKVEDASQELKKKNRELEAAINRDPLTGLYNRKYIMEKLDWYLTRKNISDYRICVGMFDLDLFKEVNDTYGHQMGDAVLREVGRIFRENIRNLDFPARYGGEEFLVVFTDTGIMEASMIAERLRKKVETEVQEKLGIRVTISGGLMQVREETSEAAIKKADTLLYQAKGEGRNRIKR